MKINYTWGWGLGIGDWGLGIGDWGLGPIPNPQSPIPIPNLKLLMKNIFKYIIIIFSMFNLMRLFKLLKMDYYI